MSEVEAAPDALPAIEETKTITFRNAVEFGGTSYASMHLREPTAAELIQADKLSGRESDARLLSLVSGLPEAVIHKLGGRDFLQGVRFLGDFFD